MLIIKTYGFDSYNQTVELETAQPLRSHGGGDTMPKVMIVQSEPIAFKDDITVKFDGGGIAFSLDTMHRQQAVAIIMEREHERENHDPVGLAREPDNRL